MSRGRSLVIVKINVRQLVHVATLLQHCGSTLQSVHTTVAPTTIASVLAPQFPNMSEVDLQGLSRTVHVHGDQREQERHAFSVLESRLSSDLDLPLVMACKEPSVIRVEDSSDSEYDSSASDFSESESENPGKRVASSLRAPEKAAIARERSILANPPGKRKRFSHGKSTRLKNQSTIHHSRVKEFAGEHLTIECNRLFCEACRVVVSEKKSAVKLHIATLRHTRAKERLVADSKRQVGVLESLRKYESEKHPKGETLQDDVRLYRMEVVIHLLAAGIPLRKADHLRPLLEKHHLRLVSSTHLYNLIPAVRQMEFEKTKAAIAGRDISVIFDGSTRLGEAVAMVVRYVEEEELADGRRLAIRQRLARMNVLSKSVTGEELCQQLITTLAVQLSVAPSNLLATMRDGAAVNGAAVRLLKASIYTECQDIICFSHTIDNAGKKFDTPDLDDFFQLWSSLFSHSCAAKVEMESSHWADHEDLLAHSVVESLGGA